MTTAPPSRPTATDRTVDLALAVWDLLDRSPGGYETVELMTAAADALSWETPASRAQLYQAYAYLRDEVQSDRGRAFITYMVRGRTVFALAQNPKRVIRYQLTRERRRWIGDLRDERNARAAQEQFSGDRTLRHLAFAKRQAREATEQRIQDLEEALKELNGV